MADLEEILPPLIKKKFIVKIMYDCHICYDEVDKIIQFSCGHKMCEDCVNNLRSLACPYCRNPLSVRDLGMKTFLMIQSRLKQDAEAFDRERLQDFLGSTGNTLNTRAESTLELLGLFAAMLNLPPDFI